MLTFFFGGIEEISLNDYYQACGCSHNVPFQGDERSGGVGLHDLAAIDNADDIYTEIATALLNEQLENGVIPERLYFETANQLNKAISAGLVETRHASSDIVNNAFNYDDTRNILKSYLTRNIYHFSAAKSLTEILEFRNLMFDKSTGEMRSFTEFLKAIIEKGKLFNETYLQTEYDTAMQSAIMAHKWDTMQSEYLEFSTVGDDRVRPEHAALDGLTYPKNHPIWNRMYPPLAWNCRCTVVPGIASKYNPKDEVSVEKQIAQDVKGTIFDNNVGKTRLIFKDNHPYYNSLKNPLYWKNYGLRSIETMQEKAKEAVSLLDNKTEYDTYWNNLKGDKQNIVLKDKNNISVLVPESFKSHLSFHKQGDRYKLLPNVKTVIEKPDEIWSVLKRGDKEPLTIHYIKYYQGKTLLVVAVDNEARTMFELTKTGFKTRTGVLLYRKSIQK